MNRPVSRRGPAGMSVDIPTFIPQNDPHNALIIWNIHKWSEIFLKKNCRSTQAPMSQGSTRRSGRKSKCFLCFSCILEFLRKI